MFFQLALLVGVVLAAPEFACNSKYEPYIEIYGLPNINEHYIRAQILQSIFPTPAIVEVKNSPPFATAVVYLRNPKDKQTILNIGVMIGDQMYKAYPIQKDNQGGYFVFAGNLPNIIDSEIQEILTSAFYPINVHVDVRKKTSDKYPYAFIRFDTEADYIKVKNKAIFVKGSKVRLEVTKFKERESNCLIISGLPANMGSAALRKYLSEKLPLAPLHIRISHRSQNPGPNAFATFANVEEAKTVLNSNFATENYLCLSYCAKEQNIRLKPKSSYRMKNQANSQVSNYEYYEPIYYYDPYNSVYYCAPYYYVDPTQIQYYHYPNFQSSNE